MVASGTMDQDCTALIADLGARARIAARALATLPTERKAAGLHAAAARIRRDRSDILDANARDVAAAHALPPAMVDRLQLDESRVEAIAAAVEAVAGLDDPVGAVVDRRERPNGLVLDRIRVPIGVIAIIYESRPNVTVDAAVLCVMAGNAAILRGGSEARQSNAALHAAVAAGFAEAGLPADVVQLVPTQDRAAVGALLGAAGLIDLVVPRGGKGLVARVQNEARVPVLSHLDGINHVYVDGSADSAMAEAVVVDAKMRRTGVCGSMETLLVDRAYPAFPALVGRLAEAGCALRGDNVAMALAPGLMTPADDADWDTEYLDAVCSVAIVDGVDQAIEHVERHSSRHTDAIVASDEGIARRFLTAVDSAIVLWNASTQFADGGEFGLGAEIGIATGRLHARGPVALEGLTTYKWVGTGTGQVRG